MEEDVNFSSKVVDWLNSQGYPLEMSVASAFKQHGFYTRISDFYDDFETSSPREIDVTAQLSFNTKDKTWFQVSCHIECKSTRDKPWLLFISDVTGDELGSLFEYVISSKAYTLFLAQKSGLGKNIESKLNIDYLPIFSAKKIGYGVAQAFSSGQDVPFKATMSAIKSAVSRVHKFSGENSNSIAFPVIVTEGKLFECYLEPNGQIRINETNSGLLLSKFPNPLHTSPIVSIVTKNSLPDFIIELMATIDILKKSMDDTNLWEITKEIIPKSGI